MTKKGTSAAKRVDRFAQLFAGYTKAYGQFEQKRANERAKVIGRAFTTRQELTLDHYARHLDGQGPGLGVIMLREDDTCYFGAIDIDDPQTDHAALERALVENGLKLVLCRSKSGGAHLYCFLAEPVPATLLQRKLQEWTAVLGFSDKTEVFPKQTTRANPADIGNWINLPYFDGANEAIPARAAMFQGQWLALDAFLDLAETRLLSERDLTGDIYGPGSETDVLYEAPPCLQHIHATGGFVTGTKRDGMFDIGIYLRKRHPDEWEEHMALYNSYFNAGLRNDELQDIIKSLRKGDGTKYSYKCKQPPINAHCQRKLCLQRKFGVGESGPEAQGILISDVICYRVEGTDDPPMWSLEVAGTRLWMSNDEFYSRDLFNKKCLATVARVPIHVPPAQWLKMVNEFAANADIQYTDRDVSETGNLEEWIRTYLRGAKRSAMDQIAVSGAFLDTETNRVWFKSQDLIQFLQSRRVEYKSEQHLWRIMRAMGGEKKVQYFRKGGSMNVWHLPAPEGHAIELPVPSFEQKVPF